MLDLNITLYVGLSEKNLKTFGKLFAFSEFSRFYSFLMNKFICNIIALFVSKLIRLLLNLKSQRANKLLKFVLLSQKGKKTKVKGESLP